MGRQVDHRERFEELYLQHAGRVRAYVARRSSPDVADDVVAEVFVLVWRRLDAVPPDPLAWILGVARRVLANRRRAEARRSALLDRLSRQSSPLSPPTNAVPAGPDDRVRRALAQLSSRDREVLTLLAWEQLGNKEIAMVLGVRPGTVGVRLHRARRRFAAALQDADAGVEKKAEV